MSSELEPCSGQRRHISQDLSRVQTPPPLSASTFELERSSTLQARPSSKRPQHPALAVAAAPGASSAQALPRSRVAAPLGPAFLLALCWPWPLCGAAALEELLSLHQPHSSRGVKHSKPRGALGTELFPLCSHRSCWILVSKEWGSFPVYSNVCMLMTIAMMWLWSCLGSPFFLSFFKGNLCFH